MTIYFLKVILCSTLFLGYYHLILQKEKTYRFNRFYLLFSLFIPFFLPLIKFEDSFTPIDVVQVEKVLIPTNEILIKTINNDSKIIQPRHSEFNLYYAVYLSISCLLLLIFIRNLFVLIKEIQTNERIVYNGKNIVLLDKKIVPYSFMKYIFVNRKEYEKQSIEKEIFLHESTHIEQGHSYDILLIELIKTFFWFNPCLYFYKKAIQLNHEFLADEAVINVYQNVQQYQCLLIEKASQSNRFSITSSFNYSITKQRLKMMTKSTSQTKALLITLAFVPLFASAIFTFSTKIYAQENLAIKKLSTNVKSTKEGASEEQMTTYKELVTKYLKMNDMKAMAAVESINKNKKDKEILISIFMAMSTSQQLIQSVGFMKRPSPLPKVQPSEKDFEAYKDPKLYGLWINEKKVENSELDKYKASDFSQVFISRLEGGAKYKNGKSRGYKFQLDMMTNDYYEKYKKETLEDDSYITYYQKTQRLK